MQDVITLIICDERVCSILQEQVDDIVVTSLRRPHGRACDRFSSFGIDIGS